MGADVSRDPGSLGDAGDHAVGIASVDRLAGDRSQDERTIGAFSPAYLQDTQDRDGERHGGWFVALTDQVQDSVSAQGLGVVLDPHGCCLGGPQGVDAEEVGQSAVVDADRLGDLEEPDQLETIQALGAGLVSVDLGEPGVDGGVGDDQTVDVRRKNPRTACIMVLLEEAMRPRSPRWRM